MSAEITHQIPKDHWFKYLEEVSREYQGWAVTVEVLLGKGGDQRVIDGLPLQGLSFEIRGSQKGDILVETGDEVTDYDVHEVHHPLTVRDTDSEPGEEMDIEIETEEGPKHLVSIRRRPALPPA
jgi:hypothetical protein